ELWKTLWENPSRDHQRHGGTATWSTLNRFLCNPRKLFAVSSLKNFFKAAADSGAKRKRPIAGFPQFGGSFAPGSGNRTASDGEKLPSGARSGAEGERGPSKGCCAMPFRRGESPRPPLRAGAPGRSESGWS